MASPNAIGKMPVASGSNVPACPAFWALKIRLTIPTAFVEVSSRGLSRTNQPCMRSPRLRAIFYLSRLFQALNALGPPRGGATRRAPLTFRHVPQPILSFSSPPATGPRLSSSFGTFSINYFLNCLLMGQFQVFRQGLGRLFLSLRHLKCDLIHQKFHQDESEARAYI